MKKIRKFLFLLVHVRYSYLGLSALDVTVYKLHSDINILCVMNLQCMGGGDDARIYHRWRFCGLELYLNGILNTKLPH